jgi:hypothetical protein
VSRVLPTPRRDELEQLRTQMAHLEQTLATLLRDRDGAPSPDTPDETTPRPAARKARRAKS